MTNRAGAVTGEDFRRAREARGLTMREASRVCGFSGEVGLLSGIESGEITKTTSKCVALICDAYGVARADAFGMIAHWSPSMGYEKYIESEKAGKRKADREIEKIKKAREARKRQKREREARTSDFAKAAGGPTNLQTVDMDYLRKIIWDRYDGSAIQFARDAGMSQGTARGILAGETRRLSYKNAVLIARIPGMDVARFWPQGVRQ